MRMRATDVLRRPVATNSSVSGIGLFSGEFDDLGLLRGMRVRITAINFQLPINMPTEPIVRNHSPHGTLDQQFRMPFAARPDILRFVTAHVSGKTHVDFL